MKTKALLITLMINVSLAYTQNTFQAIIKDYETKEIIMGATAVLKRTTNGSSSDFSGKVEINNIPPGMQIIEFRYVGYETKTDTFYFPINSLSMAEIFLKTVGEELEEITVLTTRSSRTIIDEPTRMEVITFEELDEKSNMKPGDIRMLLSESTGIQTQQTSPITGNSGIRIQGLDGRYTQILKDGFPIYSGFSGSMSIMQIPPLDLRQVEVIKGSASTLYGGGAIAGLVNLISKIPSEKKELKFHLNGTSAKGLDLNGYYAERFKKTGMTFFISRNSNEAYDPANIDLSAIPKFERYTINPRFFVYFNENASINIGLNAGFENRLGGDMHYISGIKDSIHSYFEKNTSDRISTQLAFDYKFGKCSHLTIKNSLNYFNRNISVPDNVFEGTQQASFSEVTYASHGDQFEWITGLNVLTDEMTVAKKNNLVPLDYHQTTYGAFVQNTWNMAEWITLETGIRGDFVTPYGFVALPRLSALFKINSKITSRIGGGMGYKAPTIFTEQAERIQFKKILPIDKYSTSIENSVGGNMDVNYRTGLFNNQVSFSLNQLFFYTRLNKSLVLISDTGGYLKLKNADDYIDTKGIETNMKIGYKDFKLFIGYTYTDAKQITKNLLLTPKHRLNNVLMYEIEEKWRVGLEAYYFSKQELTDGSSGKNYWICGFMAEKIWEKISLYINFENFLDVRQTKFDSIYTGVITNPIFKDIYAPLDGLVVNGGLKISL